MQNDTLVAHSSPCPSSSCLTLPKNMTVDTDVLAHVGQFERKPKKKMCVDTPSHLVFNHIRTLSIVARQPLSAELPSRPWMTLTEIDNFFFLRKGSTINEILARDCSCGENSIIKASSPSCFDFHLRSRLTVSPATAFFQVKLVL